MTAQGGGNPLVYKLGTFERLGRTFVGIVLQDSIVIDYSIANEEVARIDALYPSRDQPPRVASPRDMKDLIARYNRGLRERTAYLARMLTGLRGLARPAVRLRPGDDQDAAASDARHDPQRGREL